LGPLAAHAGTSDIIDATVVEGAVRRSDVVISSDPDDLQAIAALAGHTLEVQRP